MLANMKELRDEIRPLTAEQAANSAYAKQFADCVILRADGTLYLQRRPENWRTSPGMVNIFGGHIEEGESPTDAVIREIAEETGGAIIAADLVFIGAVTEAATNHTEAVHIHFWHDRHNTITGCFEAESIGFNSATDALAHPRLMPYARWALLECVKRNLIG